ncbi:iron-sulfur cluster assembly scaffold protein [bacterium]|nr:iron-sulfur cluster assembly scaffold protein [bacterium]
MYSKKVIDHFANPHNVGEIPDASTTGNAGNPLCGDMMRFDLKIEGDIIVDIKFKTFGCAAAIASSSVITDMAKGKTLDEAFAIIRGDVVDELGGLPPMKVHCSIIGIDALRRAICKYWQRNGNIEEHPDCIKLFGRNFTQ